MSARYGHDDATEPDYVQHEVNVAIDLTNHDVDGIKGKLMERYMKYVSKNLLEVKQNMRVRRFLHFQISNVKLNYL